MPVSLPSRQRRTTFCPAAEAGRIATDVTKPLFEFPVQAEASVQWVPVDVRERAVVRPHDEGAARGADVLERRRRRC